MNIIGVNPIDPNRLRIWDNIKYDISHMIWNNIELNIRRNIWNDAFSIGIFLRTEINNAIRIQIKKK